MSDVVSELYTVKSAAPADLHPLIPATAPGWPKPYRAYVSHGALNATLLSIAKTKTYSSSTNEVKVDFTTFQPYDKPGPFVNEDRHAVQFWDLPSGTWTFAALFDGHAGPEIADHTTEALPPLIKQALEGALAQSSLHSDVDSDALQASISSAIKSYDKAIGDDFLSIFPNGVENLSEEEIKEIVNDHASGGVNHRKAILCMRGCTALVTLVDPAKENIWVFNLGDCEAVLGQRQADGKTETEKLTSLLNGSSASEKERLKREHPGEEEVVKDDRVLGLIAVFRAISDYMFKLPAIYTSKVFMNVDPGFRMVNAHKKVNAMIPRNKTPPYISTDCEVVHIRLQPGAKVIMHSDGLAELYEGLDRGESKEICQKWMDILDKREGNAELEGLGDNKALVVLKDGFGDTLERQSLVMTIDGGDGPLLDDITILVLSL